MRLAQRLHRRCQLHLCMAGNWFSHCRGQRALHVPQFHKCPAGSTQETVLQTALPKQPSRRQAKSSLSELSAASLLLRLDSSLCTPASSLRRFTLSARAAAEASRQRGRVRQPAPAAAHLPHGCTRTKSVALYQCSLSTQLRGRKQTAWRRPQKHLWTPASPKTEQSPSLPPASPGPARRSSAPRLRTAEPRVGIGLVNWFGLHFGQ